MESDLLQNGCDCAGQTIWCPHFRRSLLGHDFFLSKLKGEIGETVRKKWLEELPKRPLTRPNPAENCCGEPKKRKIH